MLNKAHKIMNSRKEMIEEAKQVLVVLGATEEEMSTNQPIVNITINKGKIIEVPVTKEIVKQVTNDKEIDRLYEENARHIRRINELAAHNEELIEDGMKLENEVHYLQGQILGYKNTISKLEKQIEELKSLSDSKESTKEQNTETSATTVEVEETNEVPITVGGDAMALLNIPKEYANNEEVVARAKQYEEDIRNAKETRFAGQVISLENVKKNITRKAIEEISMIVKRLDTIKNYKIKDYVETIDDKNGDVTSIAGRITLGGKEYVFKHGATHELPHVFGCMDMALIKECAAALSNITYMRVDYSTLGQKHANKTIYDFDNNIVVWTTDDGCFKGYTDKYAFVWDPSEAQPCGCTVAGVLKGTFRKMNASWGNGFVARANMIMNYCKNINATKDKETQATNEVEVDFSTSQSTKEVETAWDDLDI